MNSARRLHDAAWSRIRQSTLADDRLLSACRIIVGLFILVMHPAKCGWVADMPQGLYDPPILSFGSLLSAFPSATFLQFVDTVAIFGLCAFTLGIRTRVAGIAFTIAHLIGATFAYSFGKIDHNILMPMAVLCLTFTNCGCFNALVPDKKKEYRIRGETLLALLLAFGMFTAGLPKALIWLDFDMSRSGFLAWFFEGYYSFGRQYLLAPLVLKLPPIVVESFDYVAIVFELAPFAMLLLGRRFWRGWVVFALLFHLTSGLLLNIASYIHMPVYLSFVIAAVAWESTTKATLRRIGFGAALIVTVIHLIAIWSDFQFTSLQVYLLPTREQQLYLYTLGWCLYLIVALRNYRDFLTGRGVQTA